MTDYLHLLQDPDLKLGCLFCQKEPKWVFPLVFIGSDPVIVVPTPTNDKSSFLRRTRFCSNCAGQYDETVKLTHCLKTLMLYQFAILEEKKKIERMRKSVTDGIPGYMSG